MKLKELLISFLNRWAEADDEEAQRREIERELRPDARPRETPKDPEQSKISVSA